MSETATAVESAVTAAFESPTEAPAPAITRREEVREQIASTEWKDESTLLAERQDPSVSATTDAEGAEPASGEPATPEADASGGEGAEPPPEAVIGEGGNRIVVRTADGKYAAAPDVKLEFQVGDKVYLKSPSELVRMARDGVAGQQFRQEVQQYREQVPQIVQRFEALQQELEAQRALNLEILNDEQAYLRRQEEWQLLNSPQERLRRMEEQQYTELAERRAAQEAAQRTQIVQQYYLQEIQPVQDDVVNGYAQVSMEAKLGRISIDTMPLVVNGVIPPERLPEYKAYLAGPFREWVKAEAARIDQMTAQQRAELQASIKQERQKAQQVVQSVGRQLAPNGKAAPDAPPPPRRPRNREEAKALIIGRTWQE
jgi:hypothetical protein